ncbi:phosphoenolpyruvate--protein phosphotransferase [Arthrobacter psychrolactophilus]|uniref:Phosphoenolpyruvate-protein phosphotransferase n=1 Tax=Arthrobacter psychrolactophilus TaxID=92442 RepID=A0A2V5IPZ4_9MICC|nr:phosphoenolpyruvate--protein phosphotransferase [Arthrobacter psychrolactophilus]PYI37472.1 phosphoenolpyruvate--protein phosphotransferase [Arthrobacter psychrolactophilus]
MIDTANAITGTGVVAGLGYAPALWVKPAPVVPQSCEAHIAEPERELEVARWKAAVTLVSERLSARAANASGAAAEVLEATAALASDRGLQRVVGKLIAAGSSAESATVAAIAQFIEKFEKLGGLMAERVTDLGDIRNRVISELLGLPEPGVPTPETPIILLADDLAPADTATLDPSLILGIATRLGGPTSHTAIIARQLGIPCIVAAAKITDIHDGDHLLLDGGVGTLTLGSDPVDAEARVVADAARRLAVQAWTGPGRTHDGVAVELLANVQDGAGARTAAGFPAQGVGLFRTELCFLSAQTEPSVDEQAAIYGEVLAAFPGQKVVFRTLDAGSDKPVPFVLHPDEENPALGVRGIRLGQGDPGLLERQLDAIALAAEQQGVRNAKVMAPMVATIDEARDFAAACRARALSPGIMVEVPSVALLAEAFLAEVDFMSIGTNDLTQYAMAADRMAPSLAALTDPWQPAVLHLIRSAASAGVSSQKPVGVCGEAAADPFLACVLIGLGLTSLSMAPNALAAVGLQLGSVSLEQCQHAAAAVLRCTTAREARSTAHELLS